MRFLLDTNICIYIINEHAALSPRAPLHDCAVSQITVGELEGGICLSAPSRQEANRRNVLNFLGCVHICSLSSDVVLAYGPIRAALDGRRVSDNDIWIAAHAVAYNMPLVTHNTRDFELIPGLVLQDWMLGKTSKR